MEFENVFGVISRMLFQDVRDLISLGGNTNSSYRSSRDPPLTRTRLAQKAVLSRLLILLAMAVSCAIFPNHNPGDDVVQFSIKRQPPCFCLKGQACHDTANGNANTLPTISEDCADTDETMAQRGFLLDVTYQFLLTPLTRWDASRFLNLAVHPTLRDPVPQRRDDFPQCTNDNTDAEVCQALFLPTEQAHAFFPLFPFIIRTVANLLVVYIPKSILPSTYEGVVTLAALLWNTFAFVIAALALYDLTLQLTQKQLSVMTQPEKKLPRNYCHRISYRVFLLFCVNPASVLFTTAYSESTFATCHLVGHAIWVRHLLGQTKQSTKTSVLVAALALPFWMAASYTRSNGSINAACLLLQGLGVACYWIPKSQYGKAVAGLLLCLLMALLVALPVYWHDAAGYLRHCATGSESEFVTPSWCHSDSTSRFSLYGHVQQKHWNVGIFQYYTWKKIPNFLLAAPVLLIGMLAVVDWIYASYYRYIVASGETTRNLVTGVVGWAVLSLQTSVGLGLEEKKKNDTSDNSSQDQKKTTFGTDECLLLGHLMLGHYAVLAVLCAVGLVVAHIEISTRMICSSSPAIYWYMALCGRAGKDPEGSQGLTANARLLLGKLILPYCFLFIALGVVMHPNWLPWT